MKFTYHRLNSQKCKYSKVHRRTARSKYKLHNIIFVLFIAVRRYVVFIVSCLQRLSNGRLIYVECLPAKRDGVLPNCLTPYHVQS